MNEWSYPAAPVASKFYAVARGMKAGLQPRTSVSKDRDNHLTGNDRLIIGRWKQGLYETLNTKNNVDKREEVIYQDHEEQIEPPTRNEVWEVIRTLNNNMSTRKGQYKCRIYQVWREKLWEEIHAMIEVIRASEKMRQNWRIAVICPIH
jgi:hypothetical protein